MAYRAGVTTAITAPSGKGFFRGVGVAFRSGALGKVENRAIVQRETGLHVAVDPNIEGVSVSTQVAVLRRLLFRPKEGEEVWGRVRKVRSFSFWCRQSRFCCIGQNTSYHSRQLGRRNVNPHRSQS